MNTNLTTALPVFSLIGGGAMPRLGFGTWRMGESRATRKPEIGALCHAIHAGATLFDTAEMYGDGGAEAVLGETIRASGVARERLFIVSKVYPWNASRKGTIHACEQSLKRLRCDYLDFYLLHWRGPHLLAETVAAFEELRRAGKIRHWGVSNFDTADMRELAALTAGGGAVANQIYYNLAKRWPEDTLLPWQRARGIATMAYSPLDQGRLLQHGSHHALGDIALRHRATRAQIAIAWLMRAEDVVVIPKTARIDGVNEILGAMRVKLTVEDLATLAQHFPPPPAGAGMETT